MTINLKVPDLTELKPRITVIGVGGAGGNAVNNMIATGLEGCEFVVANTDAQALATSRAQRRVQMGSRITEGLGAGSKPEIGAAAAEEALADIKGQLVGSHMIFITAGMGGGTGTGAAPVIARAAQEEGILTVGVVTKPFKFEGHRRMQIADLGIVELQNYVDTLIVIPNQNLFRVATEKTTFADAFALADRVLHSGVACITDLMVKEGLINLDFADVKTVMQGMGKAMMGTGQAAGEQRALEAAEAAISNPLLDDVSMKGAGGLLISITGGSDMTLYEVDEAASRIREEVAVEANIILGATFDESLEGHIRVSVVATGLDSIPVTKAERDAAPAAVAAPVTPEHLAARPEAPSSRLAERIENLHRPQQAPARGSSESAPVHANSQSWQGRNDVTIEKRAPRPVPLAPLSGPPARPEAEAQREAFVPQPPAAPKRPPRRMPGMEDLPPVAQNALRAREGSGPEAGLQAQKKKVGFLERLTGMRARKEETEPRRDHEPRLDVPRPPNPAPHKGADMGAPSKARLMRQAGAVRPQSPALHDEEELEIPAFLRRQAK